MVQEFNLGRVIGPQGQEGEGVPAGGTTGQVLSKNSNTNFDTKWTVPLVGATVVHGTTATVPANANKIVTVPNDYIPKEGDFIQVTFLEGNTAWSMNLNVNSSGSRTARLGGRIIGGDSRFSPVNLSSNGRAIFYFNGTEYILLGNQMSDLSDIVSGRLINVLAPGAAVREYRGIRLDFTSIMSQHFLNLSDLIIMVEHGDFHPFQRPRFTFVRCNDWEQWRTTECNGLWTLFHSTQVDIMSTRGHTRGVWVFAVQNSWAGGHYYAC